MRLIRATAELWPGQPRSRAPCAKRYISLRPTRGGRLATRVTERARALGTAYLPIETVQDIVQEELVLGGHMRAAERYILYRAERAMLRARGEDGRPAPAPPATPVALVEDDGTTTPWDGADLRERIRFASIGSTWDWSPTRSGRAAPRRRDGSASPTSPRGVNARPVASADSSSPFRGASC